MNAPNKSGWKPEMELAEDGMHNGPATTTGNRALMLEEPLIFEMDGDDATGVDFAPIPKTASRLGGLELIRDDLRARVPAEDVPA